MKTEPIINEVKRPYSELSPDEKREFLDNMVMPTGEGTKPIWDLTPEEWSASGIEMVKRAKARNFAHGLPIAYELNGRTVSEYPDGTIVYLTPEKGPI